MLADHLFELRRRVDNDPVLFLILAVTMLFLTAVLLAGTTIAILNRTTPSYAGSTPASARTQ